MTQLQWGAERVSPYYWLEVEVHTLNLVFTDSGNEFYPLVNLGSDLEVLVPYSLSLTQPSRRLSPLVLAIIWMWGWFGLQIFLWRFAWVEWSLSTCISFLVLWLERAGFCWFPVFCFVLFCLFFGVCVPLHFQVACFFSSNHRIYERERKT